MSGWKATGIPMDSATCIVMSHTPQTGLTDSDEYFAQTQQSYQEWEHPPEKLATIKKQKSKPCDFSFSELQRWEILNIQKQVNN